MAWTQGPGMHHPTGALAPAGRIRFASLQDPKIERPPHDSFCAPHPPHTGAHTGQIVHLVFIRGWKRALEGP